MRMDRTMNIIIPWPPKELSPNARTHHMKRASIAKKYKQACWALAMAGMRPVPAYGKITVSMTFCPPDNRRRDMDNALAACKAAIDGIAAAIGVDDSRFRYVLEWGAEGEGRPDGFVMVSVGSGAGMALHMGANAPAQATAKAAADAGDN